MLGDVQVLQVELSQLQIEFLSILSAIDFTNVDLQLISIAVSGNFLDQVLQLVKQIIFLLLIPLLSLFRLNFDDTLKRADNFLTRCLARVVLLEGFKQVA